MIAGNVARGVVFDLSGRVAEAIPNRFAFAVLVPGAFDLVGRGRRAPEKVVWEVYMLSRVVFPLQKDYSQPLIPLNTTPWVKIFWEKKNSRMGGTIIKTETAMMRWVLMV